MCAEEQVGLLYSWVCIVAKVEGLHVTDLSGKSAGFFADGIKTAVDSGLRSVYYLNLQRQWRLSKC